MNFILKKSNLLIAVSLIFIVIGIYFRLKGLGKWPVALDEYYILRSVQNIIAKGLPEYDFGGYYVRGIFYQYLISSLVQIGIQPEFAGRFLSVIFNILAIPALYKIIKRFSNNNYVPFIIISFFWFSVWEIEFARFARMYAFFQMLFLWYILFLLRLLFDGKEKYFWKILLLNFIGIFVYEAVIFLAVLNFIILIWDTKKKEFDFKTLQNIFKYKYSIKAILILLVFLFTFLWLKFDFRTLYSANLLPEQLAFYSDITKTQGLIKLPVLIIFSEAQSYWYYFMFLIPFTTLTYLSYFLFFKTELIIETKIILLLLSILILLNMFGLFLVLSIVSLITKKIKINEIKKKNGYILFVTALINFLFISVYSLINTDWLSKLSFLLNKSILFNYKTFLKYSLNYPDLYEVFILFKETIPIFTLLSAIILFLGLIVLLLDKKNDYPEIRFLFIILISLVTIISFLNLEHFSTRYFFFLFPIYLTLVLFLINYLLSKTLILFKYRIALLFILTVTLAFLSEDINFKHLLKIDSAEVNFRTSMNKLLKRHYYPRWNAQNISEIINKQSNSNDIIISNEKTCALYLVRLDYIYVDYKTKDFKLQSVNHGKNERWTNANLIYKFDDLKNILSSGGNNKWLIINKMWGINEMGKLDFFQEINKFLYYQSNDNLTYLYKIPGKTKI